MKTWIRHTLSTVICILLTAGVWFVCREVRRAEKHSTCEGIEVTIEGPEQFLEEEEVEEFLFQRYGAFIGQIVDSVRLDRMEKILRGHHFVRSSEVWMTNDGVLHLDVVQKTPLLRFVEGEKGFYIDQDGVAFPLHASWTAEVPVVCGKIQSRDWALAVIEIMSKCDVRGMRVSEDGSITLQTLRGEENFLFGKPLDIDAKLGLIDNYYRKIAPAGKNYSAVDIRYKDRIYCKI